MIFEDRIDAAKQLATKLTAYKHKHAIILAIPRGGLPLGYVIANQLELPLEIVLSKKIGCPSHKEYAIGAVTLKGMVLSEEARHVSQDYIEDETKRIRAMLTKRYQEYYSKKKPQDLRDAILIVVDDGVATGHTILSTIEMLYDEQPKKIVVAIPVASQSALKAMRNSPFIDDVICLTAPTNFNAVGQFYQKFDQVSDAEARALFNKETVGVESSNNLPNDF